MSVRIYVEGGGDRAEQKNRLRRGFQEFFKRAGLSGNMPEVVACGSRGKAYDRFSNIVNKENQTVLLLVDAEERVSAPNAWQHLKARDDWDRPSVASENQCHLMVQIMETWFLADLKTLKSFYGRDFRESALRQNSNIEAIPKQDVIKCLEGATRRTKKGRYHKGNHSAELLSLLDPAKVRQKSPYGMHFLRVLTQMCIE